MDKTWDGSPSVGGSVSCWLISWSVGRFVCWLVGRLVGQLVGQLVDRSMDRSPYCLSPPHATGVRVGAGRENSPSRDLVNFVKVPGGRILPHESFLLS